MNPSYRIASLVGTFAFVFSAAPALAATNLISNPSLEISVSGTTPDNWSVGGFGTNDRALTYPVAGPTGDVNGTWSGPAIDSTGGGAMVWQLTQNGASFSGTITITDTSTGLTASGTVSGTVSGSSTRFSIAIPAGGIETQPSCTANASGDAQVSGTSMTGTYTGSNSCTGSIGSGQITLNKQ